MFCLAVCYIHPLSLTVTTTAAPIKTVPPTTQGSQVIKRDVCLQSHEAGNPGEAEGRRGALS